MAETVPEALGRLKPVREALPTPPVAKRAPTTDVSGFREYTLYIKDLVTGALLPDRVEKVSSVTWSADPEVLFYVTEDHAKRAYRLWRHRLGAAADDLLFEETNELFRLHVW